MKRGLSLLVVALLGAGALFSTLATATAGDLDPSFSDDGRALINFGGQDFANDMAVQPDGKIVVAGATYSTNSAVVARLNTDGTLDSSFSGDGKFDTNFGFLNGYADAVAIRPDGRILLGAEAWNSVPRVWKIIELTPAGTVDPSFTPTTVDFGVDAGMNDLVVQSDGKIVVAGSTYATGDTNMAVARINPGGGLDPSFSGDGKLTLPGPMTNEDGEAVAIQPDGKILVAGGGGPSKSMLVVRLGSDGTVDSSFGNGGTAFANFGGEDGAYDMALQPSGRIVLAGYDTTSPTTARVAIARLDPSGAPDLTFSGDGKTTASFGGANEYAQAVALQPDGRIVVGGSGGPGVDMVLTRLNSDGAVDTTLGSGGAVAVDFGDQDALTHGLTVEPDGDIVGSGYSSSNFDIAVFRLKGDPAPPVPPAGRCSGATATQTGTAGGDAIKGTKNRDVIAALGGNDVISGLGGNDLICGGDGNDKISGGSGKDVLRGDGGADTLKGGGGADKLLGGKGADRLFGGGGRDRLAGGPGKDHQHP